MSVRKSTEDYLETILILRERKGQVRSIDIVHEKNVSKATVSVAMKRLREEGHIQMNADGYITLRPSGMEIAQRVYSHHRLISRFLERLGVSRDNAAADASRIERGLSEETFEKLSAFARKHNF